MVIGVEWMKNHIDLEVWRKSMVLVEDIYKLSSNFPKEEIYGLASQISKYYFCHEKNTEEFFYH